MRAVPSAPDVHGQLELDDDEMQDIRNKFDNNTHNGKERRERLHEQLKKEVPFTAE
jgi:hypothetical protein